MVELKKLSPEGIGNALAKVERYRLLNEPWEAESICRDVLAIDAGHRQARIGLILALTDQFRGEGAPPVADVRALADALPDAYERAYYNGIICERQAKATLARGGPGRGPVAYDWLRQAMEWYERAEPDRPSGDDSALLRWNTCARMIDRFEHLRPAPQQAPTLLE